MVSIILCHVVVHHPNVYVQMSSQFFCIGVQIFFCLSGFLLGIQGQIQSIGVWYKKRLKRIYIPWLLFVLVLGCIHFIRGNDLLTWNWLRLLLGLQGADVGVPGAGHTWFITSLLLCYMVTPLLSACVKRVTPIPIIIVLSIFPVVLAIFPMREFMLIHPICWYGIAYIAGYTYNARWLTRRNGIIALAVTCVALAIRLAVRHITDDPFVYNKLCVNYTQFVAAVGIMFFLAVVFRKRHVGKLGRYVSDISFELYLYHYMLCAGPICIFALGLPWIWSVLLFGVCGMGMAAAAHFLTHDCLENKLLNRRSIS